MEKWKTVLKKRTFKRMLHLVYLDMNVLPTWFILFLRKTKHIIGEEGETIMLTMKSINITKG